MEGRSQNIRSDGQYQNRGLRHRIPYRLLGRRSVGTKRLLVSSKVLLSTIPTQNCDVVLTFPAKTEDATLMWLLARLKSRTPALTVNVRHHSHTGLYGFYLTADYESLLQGAEELAILKPLKPEYGGGMKEFVFEDQDCFAYIENEDGFFTSQERQSIVLHFLNNLRATSEDVLEGIKFVESQPIVPMLITKNVISQVFPLHKSEDLKQLRQTWVQAFFSRQPLDRACSYFGVKIALYFAYLGHYTYWLIFPALIGLFMFLYQGTDQFLEDIFFVAFSIFNVVWASLYLKFWNRSSAVFAYKWGCFEKKDELLKDPRPLYEGDLVKSQVTGHLEVFYPPWKRALFHYFITIPIITCCLLVVFISMLLCFELQELVNELIASSDLPYVFSYFPKILLAIVVTILDGLYKQIALWLTHKENYRVEESFETNLVIKLISFQFVNSFLSLFYIGFYLGDMDRLRAQLGVLLITRQVLGNLKEALLPYVIWKVRLYSVGYRIATRMSPASVEKEVLKMTNSGPKDSKVSKMERSGTVSGEDTPTTEEDEEGVPSLTQAEVESAMTKYEDTLEDYLEMSIQFGYITLFSSAFPLAALCALVNNIFEIRSDAFKLCLTHQRPFGKRAENIGIWKDVLGIFSVIAIIVNCILVGTTGVLSRLYPGLSPVGSILFLVVIEHIIIFLKYCMEQAIPDTPKSICTEMAKLECQRIEALKQLESQITSHQNVSQQSPSSPFLRRRRQGDPRENQSMSSPDLQRQMVVTPSSIQTRPSDLSEVTNKSMSLAGFCTYDMPKPEVPPRTSITSKNVNKDSDESEKTSAALDPSSESSATEDTYRSENQPTVSSLKDPPKPSVDPVFSENQESGFQNIKHKVFRIERRGRSEPVYDAVLKAISLHKERENDGVVSQRGETTLLGNKPQTKESILRGNLRDSRLERIRQENSGEMRRASSLKHIRRRNKDSSDWIKDVGRPIPPLTLGNTSSDIVHLPPPAPPTSTRSNVAVDSPSLSRSAKLRGELSTLANRVLSRKAHSLSSADVNQDARPQWKDRHSFPGGTSTSQPISKSKSLHSEDESRDSAMTSQSSSNQNESRRDANKGKQSEKQIQEDTPSLRERNRRAQRESPSQPLSLSNKKLKS